MRKTFYQPYSSSLVLSSPPLAIAVSSYSSSTDLHGRSTLTAKPQGQTVSHPSESSSDDQRMKRSRVISLPAGVLSLTAACISVRHGRCIGSDAAAPPGMQYHANHANHAVHAVLSTGIAFDLSQVRPRYSLSV